MNPFNATDAYLEVIGKLECPSPGFVVTIRKAERQGDDPKHVDLELKVTPPSALEKPKPTETEFKEIVEEHLSHGAYETATLQPLCGSGPVHDFT